MTTDIWEMIAVQLDISDHLFEDAVDRYQSVGAFLSREGSELGATDISPHGSFALGTVTRPASDDEEYDIDLIALTKFSKHQITQRWLKEKTGDEIRLYHDRNGFIAPITESETCWTLEYADTATFKLDIVPAVSNPANTAAFPGSDPISITNTTSPVYDVTNPAWERSDPSGFVAWFRSRMMIQLNERRSLLAESLGKSVDEVPEYKVKTPLQRVVQLLKRLRNVYFSDQQFAPSSMLLTTIAGLLYKNESTVTQAFINVIRGLDSAFSEFDGKLWLPNPVDSSENLVRNWTNNELQLFLSWCAVLRATLLPAVEEKLSQVEQRQRASSSFGERIVEKSWQDHRLLRAGELSANSITLRLRKLPEIFRVRHREFPVGWSFRYDHTCVVSASADSDSQRFEFNSDSSPLPKNASLHFSVSTDTPPPYAIYYQVVNTGQEAKLAHQLRGGITAKTAAATGPLLHFESTKYSGGHYIEFFVLKGRRCVARSGPFVVNIR